jgi:hypothetical protein
MKMKLNQAARPMSRECNQTWLLLLTLCAIGGAVVFITDCRSICLLFTGLSIVLISNLTFRSTAFRIANYLAFGLFAPLMAFLYIHYTVTHPHPFAVLGHILEVVDFGVFCLLARNVSRRRQAYFALIEQHQRAIVELERHRTAKDGPTGLDYQI